MRKALLALAIALFVWGVVVALTGGIDTRLFGVFIRSRDPWRPFVVSLVLLLVQAALYRDHLTDAIDRAIGWIRGYAGVIAAVLAAALAMQAIVFGSFAVGGADAYGYVNQAYDWKSGVLPRAIPLDVKLDLPDADNMQIPLGYRTGPQPYTMVPTYAPGLPLMMAAALVFGACGPFFVVPAFAATFVWCTFRLGQRVAGPVTGVVAAIVLITSPVVLYQVGWPMSDVPAGALWTGAAMFASRPARRSSVAAAALTASGLLVRPNLIPLTAVPLVFAMLNAAGRERWIRLLLFAGFLAPVIAFVGVTNAMWFSSPLNSGYGPASEIYQLQNVIPNLKLYGSWLWSSQSGWVCLALLPIVPVIRRGVDSRGLLLCAAMCAGILACYLVYGQFEVWWYLRFLLPGFGALAVLTAVGLTGLARVVRPYGSIAAATILTVMIAHTMTFASDAGVFGRMKRSERRYVDIAEFAAKALPVNAALFSMQHSGSLRFYSGRVSLRYDWVKPQFAARVVAAVERAGYHPYLVIDDWEIPYVQEHFDLPVGLPWPIRARMRELGGLAVYDMASAPSTDMPIALEPSSEHWCDAQHRVEPVR